MEDRESKIPNKKIELVFSRIKTEEGDDELYISKGKSKQEEERVRGEALLERFSASIEEVAAWFKQYQVETIELWISGVIESAGVTRLVVSAKGEGGMKVVLKPKSQVA